MSDPTNPAGVPDIDPSTAAPQAGSEVANNPPANEPSVAEGVLGFQSAIEPAVNALDPLLDPMLPGQAVHLPKVGASREQVITLVIAMLRRDPSLATFTADDVQSDVDDATACTTVSTALTAVSTKIADTGTLKLVDGWQKTSEVYAVAQRRAAGDKTLTAEVAEIKAILATGPRAVTAAHGAVDAQLQVTRATEHLQTAQQKEAAATARVNALQHGTGDATITQPAPAAATPASTIR